MKQQSYQWKCVVLCNSCKSVCMNMSILPSPVEACLQQETFLGVCVRACVCVGGGGGVCVCIIIL